MKESPKTDILDGLLAVAEREFDATVKHFALIEDKAQKTSGLAGLFLAAAFGFMKPESLSALRQQYGLVALGLLFLALLLFVVTVVLCLRAMWLKDVPMAGVSLESQGMAAELVLQIGDELDEEMIFAFKSNELDIWRATITERVTANAAKTPLVQWAQWALTLGILVTAVSLMLLGYAVTPAVPLKQEKPMPETITTPEKKVASPEKTPASGDLRLFKFGSGKSHAIITREAALRQLENKDFIALQLRQINRAK
ncbi:MAG: hypothetical protein JWN34_5305 [Bryobacterales bacterium]|nr:hypothetical protein [Bryobacterales bacterium]